MKITHAFAALTVTIFVIIGVLIGGLSISLRAKNKAEQIKDTTVLICKTADRNTEAVRQLVIALTELTLSNPDTSDDQDAREFRDVQLAKLADMKCP